MKPKAYAMLATTIEQGVMFGLARAYKHTDTPTRETLQSCLEDALHNAFDESWEMEDGHSN